MGKAQPQAGTSFSPSNPLCCASMGAPVHGPAFGTDCHGPAGLAMTKDKPITRTAEEVVAMEIKGTPKEIASLIEALQGKRERETADDAVMHIADELSQQLRCRIEEVPDGQSASALRKLPDPRTANKQLP